MFRKEIQEFKNSESLPEYDIHGRYFECTCCLNISLVILCTSGFQVHILEIRIQYYLR